MTRQNFLRNPRVITISLLALTFVLAAVAIVTAITLQRRSNVNPTPGQAADQAECKRKQDTKYGQCCQEKGCSEENWQARAACTEAADKVYRDCMGQTEHVTACRNIDASGCGGSGYSDPGRQCGSCTSQGSDQFQGKYTCTSSGWICARASGVTTVVTPTAPNTNGWPSGAKCKFTGSGCVKGDFASGACNPEGHPGQMCVCSGPYLTSPNFPGESFGTSVTYSSASKCGGNCDKHPEGGIFSDTSCTNPYYCPPQAIATPTPPPVCAPIIYCDANGNQVQEDCNRNPVIIGKCTTTTCNKKSQCEGRDFVTRDCTGKETGRQREYPACIGTVATPSCITTYINGNPDTKRVALAPGQEVTMTTQVLNAQNNGGVQVPYNMDNLYGPGNPKPAVLPVNSPAGYSPMTYRAPANAGELGAMWYSSISGDNKTPVRTFTWKMKYEQIFAADTNNGGQPLAHAQFNAYAGGMAHGDANCVVWVDKSTTTTTSTPTPTNTATPTPTTPAGACTGISVKNNRTNVVCNSNTNPTNCDLRQGDALTVTVAGTNVDHYRVQPSWTTTQSAMSTSASSTVQIPTTALASDKITLQGYAAAGATGTASGGAACMFTAQFSSVPEVEKTIDVAGSTALVNGTSDPVVVDSNSTVKYDVYVKNTGTSGVLHNVIAVDSVTAYDANGTQLGTAFGNIVGAEDLVRTVGTKSDPATVAPRVPTGNTYAIGANVKSVEWNKINNLYYQETYHAKVTVDVLAGSTTLRNNVCLYEDSNNNGQFDYTDTNNNGKYDQGVDTPTDRLLDCDHVDVVTSLPDYTIVKEAIEKDTTDAVQVVEPGDTFRYKVTLKNTHASNTLNLAGVTVTDTFDSEFLSKFEFVSLPTGANQASNVITWPATADQSGSSLAPGASATYYITVKVKDSFFDGITECSEAVSNNVKASSTSPNYTTPVYEVFVTTMGNPACEPTPIPPSTTPNTGLPTMEIVKYIGLSLIGAAAALYVLTGRRRTSLNFSSGMPKNSPVRPIGGLNDKVSEIVSRLKNK